MIPYSKQEISRDDIDSVVKVLKSDFITQGSNVLNFEKSIAAYCGADYAIAVNSGTSALHLACLSLGLGSGDILWTSAVTFVASANCGLYCGAEIDFVDISNHDWNIDILALEKKLEQAKKIDKLPKILVVVHYAGKSADMNSIFSLSKKYNFKIIEDACHALGGRIEKNIIGSCVKSHITSFSFHPVKSITTGEGGMLTTNDEEIAKKIKLLRSHGITRDKDMMISDPKGEWEYQQIELGFNYRLSDIHSALGLSQIKKLDLFVKKRNQIAKFYDENLDRNFLDCQMQDDSIYSSRHLYPIKLKNNSKSREEIYQKLRNNKIGVNVHYIPVYRQPFYRKFGFKNKDFPVAESFFKGALSIPLYPSLSRKNQDYIVSTINELLAQ